MICPRCGGRMKIIAFLTDYAVVDRIIHHLKLTFLAERPPSASHRLSRSPDGRGDRQGIIFMTFGLSREEVRLIPGAFRLVGMLPPALRSIELNLTSLRAEVYTLSGWTKGLVTSKRFARQAQPKSKLFL